MFEMNANFMIFAKAICPERCEYTNHTLFVYQTKT